MINARKLGTGIGTLALLLFSSAAMAGTARGELRVGLTIVAAHDAAPTLAEDAAADLDVPMLCESADLRYRECRTPFRGRAQLAYEVSEVLCIEGGNWGWRDGAVWVDRGCSAVFVRAAAATANAPRAQNASDAT